MSATAALAFAGRVLALSPHRAEMLALDDFDPTPRAARSYALKNGIAIIPIHGSLSNRAGDFWFDDSYEEIRERVAAAVADPACRAIVLSIDSAGGDAAGAMETSAFIRASAAKKPVISFVDGMACSAAYALATGGQEIVIAPSATVGSIGVVALHWDTSRALNAAGLRPTLLHSGAYKVDGNSLSPLPDDARGRIQATLNEHYQHFTSTVGAHRPGLGEQGARATQAGLFVGRQAISATLADKLGTLNDALAIAAARAAGSTTPKPTLPTRQESARLNQNGVPQMTDLSAARDEARQAACQTAFNEARLAERERCKKVLNTDAAKANMALAVHLVTQTDMSPETILAALAFAPAPGTSRHSRLDRDAPRLTLGPDGVPRAAANDYERGYAEMGAALGKKIG